MRTHPLLPSVLAVLSALAVSGASAQTTVPQRPPGTTTNPTTGQPYPATQQPATGYPQTSQPQAQPGTYPQQPGYVPGQMQADGTYTTGPVPTSTPSSVLSPAVTPTPGTVYAMPPGPLPATPVVGGPAVMFGSQMFSGRFSAVPFNGFNPDYTLASGDRVIVRLWGAVAYEAMQVVDAQGHIFIPNVGPIHVAGVRNGDLNTTVAQAVKRVFRANVGVYATLEAAQPVKVYVTGFVRAPGLYGGLSSDSVLYYLDKAGGIDADRGSYMSVDVMRGNTLRARVNLYQFLLKGTIEALQLRDGDTIVVAPRRNTVLVAGEAFNPYRFELAERQIKASELLALASPTPSATHFAVVRSVGPERRSEYYPLAQADQVTIDAGDEVMLTADKFMGTIQVRIEGAQQGERTFILPYGAQLKDLIARLTPAPQANLNGLQLFRRSVALKQKENLDATLRSLEVTALTGRSSTTEEAQLRTQESAMIMQFVERARTIVPRGQVVLTTLEDAGGTLLEDGDVINLPVMSNTVAVSGEVVFPNTLVYSPGASIDQYIDRVGGATQRADRRNVMLLKPNGVVLAGTGTPGPGDEILVFPQVETKFVEVARGITSILYQLAVSAGVLNNIRATR